jgi:stage V sporulation protein B
VKAYQTVFVLVVIIGAAVGYLVILLLNIFTLRRCTQKPPAVLRQSCRSLLAALAMGIAVYGAWYGLKMFTSSHMILCAGPIMVGVAVYALVAIKLKAITREDCMLLPNGEKIAKLLHL